MSHSILNTQLRMQSTVVQMGELARDEMGKINETAVGVIGVIIERQKEKEFGWKAWNLVVKILGWAARAFWGGIFVTTFQITFRELISLQPTTCTLTSLTTFPSPVSLCLSLHSFRIFFG